MLKTLGFVKEEDLAELFAEDLGVPFARLGEERIDRALREGLSDEFLSKAAALPIREERGIVTVAMARPSDVQTLDVIQRAIKKPLSVVAAVEADIRSHLSATPSAHHGRDEASLEEFNASIEADNLLNRAIREGATDIHLEPERKLLRTRMRVDGVLRGTDTFSVGRHRSVRRRVMIVRRRIVFLGAALATRSACEAPIPESTTYPLAIRAPEEDDAAEAQAPTAEIVDDIAATDAPADVAEVELLIEAIDEVPRQVLIEARMVEIGLDTRFEAGIATSFGDISAGSTASTLATDFLQTASDFTFTTIGLKSDVDVILQALQQFGTLHVIANPRVIALNHELAKIDIIERIPYIEATATTTTEANGAGSSTVEQVEFEEVGIRLHVTPVLGDGDLITLKIIQEVSEVVDFFNGVPVTDERNVDTKFVVSDIARPSSSGVSSRSGPAPTGPASRS